MRMVHGLGLLALGASLVGAGCNGASSEKPKAQSAAVRQAAAKASEGQEDEAAIQANLAQLSPEDRKLAEAQKYCAVQTDDRLGEMAVPVKLTIKGQPVFLCCKGCQKKALADPDKTLERVKELKAQAAAEPAK